MLNGNPTGAYNAGASLPKSNSAPANGDSAQRLQALKSRFDQLAGQIQNGTEPTLAASNPVVPSEGTSATATGKSGKQTKSAVQGALKGATANATDDEAVRMLQALFTPANPR